MKKNLIKDGFEVSEKIGQLKLKSQELQITNDIENYISKNGLQDRLKFSDIREVLEGVYSIKKGQNLRGNGTETRLLASAIEATEEVTRSSTINNQAQNIKMIDKKKEETEKGTENR